MIVESIVLGVSAIVTSSLWFADRAARRQRDAEIKDSQPEPEPPAIDPFIRIIIGTPCPKCSYPATDPVIKTYAGSNQTYTAVAAQGPALPKACTTYTCPADKYPHLHASCRTCNYKWFMAPADYIEKKKPKSDLELFDDLLKEDNKCRQDTHTK